MQFHTTEDLFGALSIPEIRRVVLQSATEAETRAETLKVLVGDRYGDLIGTADEAAEMFRGVQRLEQRIKELRRSSMVIFTASKPGGEVGVRGSPNAPTPGGPALPSTSHQAPVREALGEWGAGKPSALTTQQWLPASVETIASFLDRGWPWRAACSLVTAEALSHANTPATPLPRQHRLTLLQGSRVSVLCGARAALALSLTSSGGGGEGAASAFAALLLLRAAGECRATPSLGLGDAAAGVVAPLLTSALLNPAAAVVGRALEGGGGGLAGLRARLGHISRAIHAVIVAYSVLFCERSGEEGGRSGNDSVGGGCLLDELISGAQAVEGSTSGSGSGSGVTGEWLRYCTPLPQWRAALAQGMLASTTTGATPTTSDAASLALLREAALPSAYLELCPPPTTTSTTKGASRRGGAASSPSLTLMCRSQLAAWVREQTQRVTSALPGYLEGVLPVEGGDQQQQQGGADVSGGGGGGEGVLARLQALFAAVKEDCSGLERGTGGAAGGLSWESATQASLALPTTFTLYTSLFEEPFTSATAALVRRMLAGTVGSLGKDVSSFLATTGSALLVGALQYYNLNSSGGVAGVTGASPTLVTPSTLAASFSHLKARVDAMHSRSGTGSLGASKAPPPSSTSSAPATAASLSSGVAFMASRGLLLSSALPEILSSAPLSAASVAILIAARVLCIQDGDGSDGSGLLVPTPFTLMPLPAPSPRSSLGDILRDTFPSTLAASLQPLTWDLAAPKKGWAHPLSCALTATATTFASRLWYSLEEYASHCGGGTAGKPSPTTLALDLHGVDIVTGFLRESVVAPIESLAASVSAGQATSPLPVAYRSLALALAAASLAPLLQFIPGLPKELLNDVEGVVRQGVGVWATLVARHCVSAVEVGWWSDINSTTLTTAGSDPAIANHAWRACRGQWTPLSLGEGGVPQIATPSHSALASSGLAHSAAQGGISTAASDTVWVPHSVSTPLASALARGAFHSRAAGCTGPMFAPPSMSKECYAALGEALPPQFMACSTTQTPTGVVVNEYGIPVAASGAVVHSPSSSSPSSSTSASISSTPLALGVALSMRRARLLAQITLASEVTSGVGVAFARLETAVSMGEVGGGGGASLPSVSAAVSTATNSSSTAAAATPTKPSTAGGGGWDELLGSPLMVDTLSSGGGVKGAGRGKIPDAAILQAALDTLVMAHLFPGKYELVTQATPPPPHLLPPTNSSPSLWPSFPLFWPTTPGKLTAASLLPPSHSAAAAASATATPPHLPDTYRKLIGHLDAVDVSIFTPHLWAAAGNSIRSHAVTWAPITPSLASQALLPLGPKSSLHLVVGPVTPMERSGKWSLEGLLNLPLPTSASPPLLSSPTSPPPGTTTTGSVCSLLTSLPLPAPLPPDAGETLSPHLLPPILPPLPRCPVPSVPNTALGALLSSAPPPGVLASLVGGSGGAGGGVGGGLGELGASEGSGGELGGGRRDASLPLLSSLPSELRDVVVPKGGRGGRGMRGEGDGSAAWGGKEEAAFVGKEGGGEWGGLLGGVQDGSILAGALRSSAAAASALLGNLLSF